MDSHVGGGPFLVERRGDKLLPCLVATAVADKGNIEEAVLLEASCRVLEYFANTSSGVVIVPVKRMWPVGGSMSPSGTYATTGATSAFPSCLAIAPALYFTR